MHVLHQANHPYYYNNKFRHFGDKINFQCLLTWRRWQGRLRCSQHSRWHFPRAPCRKTSEDQPCYKRKQYAHKNSLRAAWYNLLSLPRPLLPITKQLNGVSLITWQSFSRGSPHRTFTTTITCLSKENQTLNKATLRRQRQITWSKAWCAHLLLGCCSVKEVQSFDVRFGSIFLRNIRVGEFREGNQRYYI